MKKMPSRDTSGKCRGECRFDMYRTDASGTEERVMEITYLRQ